MDHRRVYHKRRDPDSEKSKEKKAMDKKNLAKHLAASGALCALLAMSLLTAQTKPTTTNPGSKEAPQMHLFIDVFTEENPTAQGVPQTCSDQPAIFKILQNARLAWTPFLYRINEEVPSSIDDPNDAVAAFQAAFETWDAEVSLNLFQYDGPTTDQTLDWTAPDFENSIFFMDLTQDPYLSQYYPPEFLERIIAITLTWFAGPGAMSPNGNGFHYAYVIDFDMAYNTNILGGLYPWSTDQADLTWDLQEVALHEAGHTLFLDDLYMKAACGQTMYGYGVPVGYKGHVQDWTLGNGDILGVRTLYKEARN